MNIRYVQKAIIGEGGGSMRRNRLGSSAVEVTELSFGAAAIGNLFTAVEPERAAAAVAAAWDEGVRYFDTAPHYGLGLSERRLGEALRDRPRDAYVLSTKVGRVLDPLPADATGRGGDGLSEGFAVPATHRRRWDFSADGVRRSIEDSLERLGLDRIDIVYLHDPDDHAETAFHEAYPELEKLRAQGVVGAIGAGMNQTAMLTRFLRDTDVDVVLCAGRYTLLDQSALNGLLPEAAARGRSVVVGGVFNSGLLADPRPGATYDYTAAPSPSWTGPCASRPSPRATASRCGPPLSTTRSPTPPSPECWWAPAPRTRCATPPPCSAARSRTSSGTSCAPRAC